MKLDVASFTHEQAEQCLQKIQNKRIVCYGASANYKVMNAIVHIEHAVEFFVDSDPRKWGQEFCGKIIKAPKELNKLERDDYIIIVLPVAAEEIGRGLDCMGLKKGVNYFSITELLGGRNELIRDINAANKLLEFLSTVPGEMKERILSQKTEKIGIVLSIEGFNVVPDFPFSVALFLILKWKGYHVNLIVDNLNWTGDIELYEGVYRDRSKILKAILHELERLVPKGDIKYVNSYGKNSLSETDERICEQVAAYSAKWQKWQNVHHFAQMPFDTVRRFFVEAFKKNFGYIDAFFENEDYESVNITTALHKRAGVIASICKKRGIRVSSQDGTKGQTYISADGVAGHGYDIDRVIRENWISAEQEEKLLQKSARMAEMRFEQNNSQQKLSNAEQYIESMTAKGQASISFQAPKQELKQSYDVIIPLNIEGDAAALGFSTCFIDIKQWLKETLDFVINRLGKNVLLREHPALRMVPPHLAAIDLATTAPEVLEPYAENKLLHYANFDEELNLYQYIKQCKVVLPWTSTVGIEAGVLRKNVVVHTDLFYGGAAFAGKAESKEEYFELISKCIADENCFVRNKSAYEDALKYFYFSRKQTLYTKFTSFEWDYHCITHAWLGMTFEELLEEKGVDEIVQIVAENVPSVYLTAQQC